MEALFISTLLVAVAEIGDKTQLLAILLAARFQRPWPVIGGILVATLANHLLAASAGYFLAGWLASPWLQVAVGAGFIAMAAWALIPDKVDDLAPALDGRGVFVATTIAFFLVEIGDKTQVATVALAARFHEVLLVTAGTTIGMMLANVPAVFLGEAATKVVPLRLVRIAAAAVFAVLGVWTVWNGLTAIL